jgi:hypothetical protein
MYLFITDIFYVHSFDIKLLNPFKKHISSNWPFLENLLYCSKDESKVRYVFNKNFPLNLDT